MSTTLQVNELPIKGYILSVTARDGGDDPAVLEELTFRTINAWLYIVKLLLKQKYVLDDEIGSVEERYCAEMDSNRAVGQAPISLPDKWGDPRVTVWDLSKTIRFHLNSDDTPQVAIDTWVAQQRALARVKAEYEDDESQSPPAPRNPFNPALPSTTPVAPQEGVIVATLAPTPNKPQYADGQLVQFTVNKIVAGTGQGTITYALWGPLGVKYPLMTIFKNKKGSDENSANYIAAAETLVALGLSVDAGRIEAVGNWRLLVKAAHKDGREFTNVISLEAI